MGRHGGPGATHQNSSKTYIKAIVIACNTATAVQCGQVVLFELDIKVVEVIDAGAKVEAAEAVRSLISRRGQFCRCLP